DFVLKEHQPLQKRLGPRGAAGDIDVDRDDQVDAGECAVAVGEGAADGGARTHRDDPAGLGHLKVDPPYGSGHLPGDGSGDDHEVGLAGRGVVQIRAGTRDVV